MSGIADLLGAIRRGDAKYRMMALEVADMPSTIDYLKTKGVPITWGPWVREGEYARAEIRDPDGHGIELRQWFGRK